MILSHEYFTVDLLYIFCIFLYFVLDNLYFDLLLIFFFCHVNKTGTCMKINSHLETKQHNGQPFVQLIHLTQNMFYLIFSTWSLYYTCAIFPYLINTFHPNQLSFKNSNCFKLYVSNFIQYPFLHCFNTKSFKSEKYLFCDTAFNIQWFFVMLFYKQVLSQSDFIARAIMGSNLRRKLRIKHTLRTCTVKYIFYTHFTLKVYKMDVQILSKLHRAKQYRGNKHCKTLMRQFCKHIQHWTDSLSIQWYFKHTEQRYMCAVDFIVKLTKLCTLQSWRESKDY